MKKSNESEKSKSSESSKELVDPHDAIRRNDYKPPKKIAHKYIKNERDGNIVYSYAAYGATNEDIAAILGMDNKTVTKHYPAELRSGRATAHGKIAQRLYNISIGREASVDQATGQIIEAIPPHIGGLIFLAKTRLGWKETQVVQQTVDVKSGGIKIYLPDNGMKTEK